MYIENINGPEDVKKLSEDQLNVLAEEIRDALLNAKADLEFDTDDLSACGIDSFRGVLPHFPVFIYRFFFDIFYLIGIHDL